jgi:transposase
LIYVRRLSEAERKELKRLARREIGMVSERIRMVLLSDRRYSVPQIASIFDCSEATVRQWLERFESEGVQGLRDRPRSGRPRKADTVAREVIRQQMETPPAAAGYIFGYWTVVTLCSHLAYRLGLCLSRATVRRVLWALDYRWRRPRHSLPVDPEKAAKMWALCERIIRAPAEAVILCADECDVHLLPVLRAMWMRQGQQVRVPTPGKNRRRSVFGALELATGCWHYDIFERKRSVEFIAFLEKLVVAYPGKPLLLVVDNASIHKSKVTRAWLAAQGQVELLYLPTYSGHKENPVEKVWWRLKDRVAANRLHGSIEELVKAVHEFFASFTPEAARQLAA